jgi:hypothetical protein
MILVETLESKGLFIMNYQILAKKIIFQKIILLIGWGKYWALALRHIVMTVYLEVGILQQPI